MMEVKMFLLAAVRGVKSRVGQKPRKHRVRPLNRQPKALNRQPKALNRQLKRLTSAFPTR